MAECLTAITCLNPCSNGMTIEFIVNLIEKNCQKGLNPCSNGMTIESWTAKKSWPPASLNPCSNGMTIEYTGTNTYETDTQMS